MDDGGRLRARDWNKSHQVDSRWVKSVCRCLVSCAQKSQYNRDEKPFRAFVYKWLVGIVGENGIHVSARLFSFHGRTPKGTFTSKHQEEKRKQSGF